MQVEPEQERQPGNLNVNFHAWILEVFHRDIPTKEVIEDYLTLINQECLNI